MDNALPHRSKVIVKVPCAIIEHEGRILAAQRAEGMSLSLKWEFPGGKIDGDETEIEALVREIKEELNVEVSIGARQSEVYKDDTHRVICLIPYICELITTQITLTEHRQYRWLTPEELPNLDWAEADIVVLNNYLKLIKTQPHQAGSAPA